MDPKTKRLVLFAFAVTATVSLQLVPASIAPQSSGQPTQEAAAGGNTKKQIGVIKAIAGSSVILTPDSSPEVEITVQASTHIVRIAPGAKTLKDATQIQLQDLQVGDRILVAGKTSENAKAITAASIVVMKRSDVEARQEHDRQDWQTRGLGGLVSAVDPPAGTATISVTGSGGVKTIVVRTSKDTVIRRYAQDSTKFDDAKPSSLLEIHPGDQLRARGNRSADGVEFAAEEIVTGAFRHLAGTVNSVDASAGTISVQDLVSKKPIQVKVTGESQLHHLPPELAQRIAMRLRAAAAGAAGGDSNAGSSAKVTGNAARTGDAAQSEASARAPSSAGGEPDGRGGMGGGMRSGGAPDFQQILNRMPSVALTDLHKGDVVMIVATQGTPSGLATVITLLDGVEPILRAAPNASQAMMLTPWSLGGSAGSDALNQ